MSKRHHEGLLSSFLLITGAIIGAASVLLYKENRPKKPGAVLEQARLEFARQGAVEGSWINYETIEYPHLPGNPLAYIGGISRIEDAKLVQYQFICDAYSGEILSIYTV